MKINFKSTQLSFDRKEVMGKINFSAKLDREIDENGFDCLTFEENRDGKKITNRFEFNETSLKIFSGVSSLTCELNECVKNNWIVGGQISSVSLYTKMLIVNIEDKNKLLFEYIISANENCIDGTIIKLELEIFE